MSIVLIPEQVEQEVPKGATARIKFQVQDYDSANVLKANISAATLTLYNKDTNAIINSVNEANVLASIDTNGLMTYILDPDDNVIVASDGTPEEHVARFTIVGTSGDGNSFTDVTVINFHVVDLPTPN